VRTGFANLINSAQREQKFGKVREIISTDFQGHKVVAVGSGLHFSKRWKTFPDFLRDYAPQTMGKDWWSSQFKLPSEKQSPVIEWAIKAHGHQSTTSKAEGGDIFSTLPNGPMHAFYTFAYDLYVLKDNLRLQDEVISRLKRREHFFGARYELLVAATFIRAGFDIRYENEKDNSSKHPEFVAKHPFSDLEFDVEAKKRNRASKLSQDDFDSGRARIGVRDLLASAVAKFRGRPFIVFVDIDVPPIDGNPFTKPWSMELLNTQSEAGDRTQDGKDKCNWVVYTNFPIDYHTSSLPRFSYVVSQSTVPLIPVQTPVPYLALNQALTQFGKIPNSFDE